MASASSEIKSDSSAVANFAIVLSGIEVQPNRQVTSKASINSFIMIILNRNILKNNHKPNQSSINALLTVLAKNKKGATRAPLHNHRLAYIYFGR